MGVVEVVLLSAGILVWDPGFMVSEGRRWRIGQSGALGALDCTAWSGRVGTASREVGRIEQTTRDQ